VSEDDVSLEGMMMRKSSVLDHGVGDGELLFTDELASTTRAGLCI